MNSTRNSVPHWLHPSQLWAFLCRPRTRYVLAWLAAATVALITFVHGWVAFEEAARRDGNCGHAQIDFGGQWLLARMLVAGHGHDLYNRDVQREVLKAGYPEEDQAPNPKRSDAEQLMIWMMGSDDPELPRHVGGPLYPPIHPLLHFPLGFLRPRIGYRIMQFVPIPLGLLAAWGVRQLSGGRIWWPMAALVIFLYPGFGAAVNLGQNPVLTLTILVWGWVFLARGQEGLGGAVWGLLAYKPVWAVAFFPVLLLSGRWRAGLAMLGSAAVLAALTLPLVGVQSWFDWLAVGHEAALLYNVEENWIKGGRDLLGIPRRWTIDFSIPYTQRDKNWLPPLVVGWGLIVLVVELTVRIAMLRRRSARAGEGPPAAFLLLAGWLTCFHFMYYDVLLTALPALLLFCDWRQYLHPRLLALLPLSKRMVDADVQTYFEPRRASTVPPPLPLLQERPGKLWVLNSAAPTLVAGVLLSMYIPGMFYLLADAVPPIDTYCLIALWLWCGWRWLQAPPWSAAQAADHPDPLSRRGLVDVRCAP